MNSFFKTLFLGIIPFLLLLTSSCHKNDQEIISSEADLENAQIKDFQFFEVSYLNIKIVHPEIAGGVEQKHGEIEITIPRSQRSSWLRLKEVNLDLEKYSISPMIGAPQDFSKGPVTYTISSNLYRDKAVHYNVKVVYEGEPINQNAEITGFKFEKSKNPSLPASIDALKIVEYGTESLSNGAIYVMVPLGTDFSNLVPTIITANDVNLSYSEIKQVNSNFKPYPKDGMAVDFKYPKAFRLMVKTLDELKIKYYEVIVDVKDPIKFVEPAIITPDIKKGEMKTHFFASAGRWINQGNHPIRGMAISNYKDKIYPFTGYTGNITGYTGNIITAFLRNPKSIGGILPRESGFIDVTFRATTFGDLDGIYKTTAEITPNFRFDFNEINNWPVDDRIESIFEAQSFTIQTTIKE